MSLPDNHADGVAAQMREYAGIEKGHVDQPDGEPTPFEKPELEKPGVEHQPSDAGDPEVKATSQEMQSGSVKTDDPLSNEPEQTSGKSAPVQKDSLTDTQKGGGK